MFKWFSTIFLLGAPEEIKHLFALWSQGYAAHKKGVKYNSKQNLLLREL